MQQYKLTFKLEKNWLPKELDRLIVSFLKASTQAYSQNFYERLYDKSQSIIKSFTYSYFLPGAKFNKDRIELQGNEFSMFFSDADWEELLYFFNSFQLLKYKKCPMNDNSMEPKIKKDSYAYVEFNAPLDNKDIGLFFYQNQFLIRRFIVRKDGIALRSENRTDIPDILLDPKDNFYIVGKVVGNS